MSGERVTLSDELERRWLRIDAGIARLNGIDVTRPGWGEELEALDRDREAQRAELDRLIATPYIDEAIDRMEQQFEETP
jgi:hypothetical protein